MVLAVGRRMCRVRQVRWARLSAFLLCGVATAVAIRHASFAASYTDPAGYLNQARGLLADQQVRPSPVSLWAAWRYHLESTVSFASRADLVLGTEVGVFPLGNPLLIAAAQSVGGELGGYLVAPAMLGVLMACAFALAERLAGWRAGLLAALVIGTAPSLIVGTVQTMSDVPAAAFWALAFVMAARGTTSAAMASGASAAMAFMIRPQIALLGLVPACLVLLPSASGAGFRPRAWRWRGLLAFLALAAIGPAIIAWSQDVLYGSPTTPGYPGPWTNFSLSFAWSNLRTYPRLLVVEHSPVLLLGLAAVPWHRRLARLADADRDRSRLVAGLIGWVPLNFLAYLFYLPFDDWGYLRFMAPALFALAVLFAATAVWLGDRLAEGNPRIVAAAVTLALAAVPLVAVQARTRQVLRDEIHNRRVLTFGRYMAATLPANALLVTCVHATSAIYYTGKPIVRFDIVEPAEFDAVIASIIRHGYQPYLLLEERYDGAVFRDRFAKTSRYGALDWAPRAASAGYGPIELRSFSDRELYRAGTRWPIDVVAYR